MSEPKNSWFKRGFGAQIGPLLALIFVVALFAIADNRYSDGKFLTASNLRTVTNDAALVAVPALGMTMIIIAAGIDLSAGTALTLCGTVLALYLRDSVVPADHPDFNSTMIRGLAATIGIGCLCGFINGLLISATKVVPFIVTLGTMTIFLGVGQIFASESNVGPDRANIPEWLNLSVTSSDPSQYLIPGVLIPTSVMIAVVLAIIVGLVMRYTVFGRNVFAIGSSESTARLCGINVSATIVWVYTLAGFLVAIGGVLYFANVKVASPNDGTGMELEIIAAVVLGGGSLNGGRGSIVGTLLGALIIKVIESGCTQLDIPNTYTHIIIGVIIIIAVIVDQLRNGSPEWFFRLLPKKND